MLDLHTCIVLETRTGDAEACAAAGPRIMMTTCMAFDALTERAYMASSTAAHADATLRCTYGMLTLGAWMTSMQRMQQAFVPECHLECPR